MSGLQWALLLQATYFFSLYFVKFKDGEKIWEWEIKLLSEDPLSWFTLGILSFFPYLPLILAFFPSLSLLITLLSLTLYPTVWIFSWLVVNIILWLSTGISMREEKFIVPAVIAFVILLINLKLTSAETFKIEIPKVEALKVETPNKLVQASSTDLWSSGWFLPVKILIAVASVIGILFLLRWMLREFFPNLNEKAILENVIVTVISGVVATGLAYLLFGDPTAATIPGLLAAASIYLFNQQRA